MGQEVSGAGRRGAGGQWGRTSLGQYPWGNIPGAEHRRGAELRGAGRRWGKISGAGGHGAEGSGAGSGSPTNFVLFKIVSRSQNKSLSSLIKPILLYGCQVLAPHSKTLKYPIELSIN